MPSKELKDTMKKVLVIDDEPDVVDYLSTFLEDEGFAVITAQNGPDGLEAARLQSPDLITLDITMPGMSGIEVLTVLRREPDLSHIPVIVITGVADFQTLVGYREVRPPEGFMQKPIELESLIATINKVFEAK